MISSGGKQPHLAAILVGTDGASETYVNAKARACKEIGFKSTIIKFSEDVIQDDVLLKIEEMNNSEDVDGLIVQLPLPSHFDEKLVTHKISYTKDVDGFHPMNIGRMVLGLPCYLPATPFGIVNLMQALVFLPRVAYHNIINKD